MARERIGDGQYRQDVERERAPQRVVPPRIRESSAEAALVILYFMHVKYGEKLVKLMVVVSIAFLVILFLITLSDYWTRNALGAPGT